MLFSYEYDVYLLVQKMYVIYLTYFWQEIQIVLFKYYFWIHLYFLHSISSLEHTKDIVSTFIKDLQKILALSASYISENYFKIKINLNFYFRTSLWCLRRFYGGLKDLHKTFEAPQRSPKVKI